MNINHQFLGLCHVRAGGLIGFAPALIAGLFAVGNVTAQEQVPIIEEIVVTATKREQTLQQVPVAVSVISGDVIRNSQILDVKDLQFLVPSLKIGQLQTTANTNFRIRGFGNGANNAGIEPSVGVFIDGVYRSRSASALADLPNLERIEVLRGPQSTLFGKNASAGIINVITAKPSLDGYVGSVSATFGDYSQVLVKGDVSGPMSDTAAFSLSGSYNQRDGYFTNLNTGAEISELDRYGIRGQLYFKPSDTFELRIIGDFEKMDELCCGVANLFTGPAGIAINLAPVLSGGAPGQVTENQPFAYANYYNFEPTNKIENSGLSAQFDWDINDSIALTSITAYRNHKRFDNSDSDFTSADLLSQAAGNFTDSDIDTITQEFRLAGGTERLDWMLGFYYFDEEVSTDSGVVFGADFRNYVDIFTKSLAFQDMCSVANPDPLLCNPAVLGALISDPTIPSPIGVIEAGLMLPPGTFQGEFQGNTEQSGMDNQAISLFAQFDFELGDRTTLTLGANYTEDEKDSRVSMTTTDAFSALDLVTVGGDFVTQQVFNELVLLGFPPAQAIVIATQVGAAGAPVQCDTAGGIVAPACNPLLALQAVQFLPPFVNFPNAVESGRTRDDQTTWTVRLAFDVNDSVNIYASAGTGFKASSWNLSRDSRPFASDITALETAGLSVNNLVAGTRFADPEDSTLYELGLKTTWDTGALNIAIFNQEIEEFQSNIFTGTGFSLANAGKQSTDGIEVDLTWYPTEAFRFTIAGTWLDPIYDSFVGAEGPDGPVDLSGTTPAGVHELSIVTSGQYNFDVTSSSDGFIRLEYLYEDEVQVVENVPANIASREVSEINASIGIRWQNGFEAMLWGRNLTDDQYLISAFPTTVQPGSFNGYPNQPRSYGLTVRKYFD
ncbi:MAG: TonB-dependent receptor [Proteobacteria bacterium]|nr:TonB-dependent receptor [Pseudomonadota bacterium]